MNVQPNGPWRAVLAQVAVKQSQQVLIVDRETGGAGGVRADDAVASVSCALDPSAMGGVAASRDGRVGARHFDAGRRRLHGPLGHLQLVG